MLAIISTDEDFLTGFKNASRHGCNGPHFFRCEPRQSGQHLRRHLFNLGQQQQKQVFARKSIRQRPMRRVVPYLKTIAESFQPEFGSSRQNNARQIKRVVIASRDVDPVGAQESDVEVDIVANEATTSDELVYIGCDLMPLWREVHVRLCDTCQI